jgi:hypothetical protein
MSTNIYIQSDFQEDYDECLHDPNGKIIWERLSNGGMKRREILCFIDEYVEKEKSYFGVPPHGIVKDLYNKYITSEEDINYNVVWEEEGFIFPCDDFIIYTDESLHRGEGKIKISREEALKKYPDSYASIYLHRFGYNPTSTRFLCIGNRKFILHYTSLTDRWRSNYGHVVIQLLGEDKNPQNKLPYPIYSLDYIYTSYFNRDGAKDTERAFLIDFNIAPGIPEKVFVLGQYEPISFYDIISKKEIAEEIKNKLNKVKNI